jgi:hypothetical protein
MSTQDTNEFIDSTTDAEDTVTEEVLEEVTEDESGDDIETVRESNKRLFERAKAAEDKLRSLKKERYDAQVNAQKKDLPDKGQSIERDELKLIARGLSDEEIDEAKSIARGKDITLTEALKTKSFLAYQKELREDAKKEEAKLGATRGSSQAKKETFHAGMTTEEHKALWNEKYGK